MNSIYQTITDRIIAELEQGTVPWHKPWAGGNPVNLASKKEYRGINVLLLGFQDFESPYWVTYKQAKKLGGHVNRGQKGTQIVYWNWTEKEEVSDNGEKETKRRAFLKAYTVFNTDQCSGLEAPTAKKAKKFSPIKECEKIVKGFKNAPEIAFGGAEACYFPLADKIKLPPKGFFDGEAAFYSTLFHELVHSTGHKKRLNRSGVDGHSTFGTKVYSEEELIAEIGACFLCTKAKIENKTIENSAAYLRSWLKRLRNDSRLIVVAASAAQKAADLILDKAAEQKKRKIKRTKKTAKKAA